MAETWLIVCLKAEDLFFLNSKRIWIKKIIPKNYASSNVLVVVIFLLILVNNEVNRCWPNVTQHHRDVHVTFKDYKYDLLVFQSHVEHYNWMSHRFWWNQHFVQRRQINIIIVIIRNIAFGALSKVYVSKSRNITSYCRSMVGGVFENWWFMFFEFHTNICHKNSSWRIARDLMRS